MFRYLISSLLFLCIFLQVSNAQTPRIVSGPFQGATTPTSTEIWMMVAQANEIWIENYSLRFVETDETEIIPLDLVVINDSLSIASIKFEGLESGFYDDVYLKLINHKKKEFSTNFIMQIPDDKISDFSFLAGSCSWPLKTKSRFWKIYETMLRRPSDFMMWMGDNVYLLKGSWENRETINETYIKNRTQKEVNAFLKSRVNYAAWDDHDFGPNNAGGEFENKDKTLGAFKDFWRNPSYGTDSLDGTFYSFEWQDVELFVLDGRYHRTLEEMYGKSQMDWLKKGIRNSTARVKFIVGGSQFLVHSGGEDWGDYPAEKNDFLSFIKEEKIEGLVFLSGDRHFAELTISEEKDMPKLLEITSSPLTSFVNPFASNKSNTREKGTLVKRRNFAQIFLEGEGEERKLRIELRGRKGKLFWSYEVLVNDLK
ncbi:MAG: alkaline phosphatase D [Maribacter sp.]|jgi:alkaline phosphatase D